MIKTNNKGFTLIELMVVITIIGILAVGGTQIYTTQIQKARDSGRVSDITKIHGSITQYVLDTNAAPTSSSVSGFTGAVNDLFNQKIPQDSKKESEICVKTGTTASVPASGEKCGYVYITDGTNVDKFEVSTAFENKDNTTNKSSGDGGNSDFRYELGDLNMNLATNRGVTSGILMASDGIMVNK